MPRCLVEAQFSEKSEEDTVCKESTVLSAFLPQWLKRRCEAKGKTYQSDAEA